jgi:hypothetical protein
MRSRHRLATGEIVCARQLIERRPLYRMRRISWRIISDPSRLRLEADVRHAWSVGRIIAA